MANQPGISSTRIAFVRHGLVHQRENFYGRQPGFWLGPEGQEQAQATALVLAAEPVAAVLSSPLLRARQTAAAIHERLADCPFKTDERLLEVATPYDGQPSAVLVALNYDLYTGSPEEFEQPADVVARTLAFAREMCRQYAGGRVVAVTHGDVIAFLLVWALGLPVEPASRNRLPELGLPEEYPACASVTTLEWETAGRSPRVGGVIYQNPGAGLEKVLLPRARRSHPDADA